MGTVQTNTVSNIAICTSSNGWEAGRRESNKVEMETNTLGKDKYFKYLDNYSWQFTKIQRPVQAAIDWEAGQQRSGIRETNISKIWTNAFGILQKYSNLCSSNDREAGEQCSGNTCPS